MKGKFIYLDKAEEAPLHMVLKPTKDGFVAYSTMMPEACGVGASKGDALNRAWSAVQANIERRAQSGKRTAVAARHRRARLAKSVTIVSAESEIFIVPPA